MRLLPAIACLLVAWDCADKATGAQSQTLFNPSHVWVWWFAVSYWVLAAIGLYIPKDK